MDDTTTHAHFDAPSYLGVPEWLTMPPEGSGIVVHDVHREEVP